MHVAIRSDGGSGIGYGHLVRSSTVAEEMLSRGHQVTFATTTPEPVREVGPEEAGVHNLPVRDDPDPFVGWIDSTNPNVVFSDAYPVDTAYQKQVRNRVPLVVFQDDARHIVCADVFINGNLYAQALDYDFAEPAPKTHLGSDYVLLRDEIRRYVDQNPSNREEVEYAMITMGGSDINDLTPSVVRAFDGLDFRVDVVVGPGFSSEQEQGIRDTAADVSPRTQVVRDPDDLPKRMFRSDFAVSTSSSTTYELLALGTPIVSRPVVDNQVLLADALRERDAALVLDREGGESEIHRAITRFVSSPSLRRKYSVQGRRLVDGHGASRVGDIIESLVEAA